MTKKTLSPVTAGLNGKVTIPGDKSVSHRSIMFASLAEGKTKITNFLDGEDCLRTVHAFEAMGVKVMRDGTNLEITSPGMDGLKEPVEPLNFGNSGTTTRLMLGILAGLPLFSTFYGDSSLSKRPMDRVVQPLRQMDATIMGRNDGNLAPIAVNGGQLKGITYKLPVKSAQVKSAVLLAGLFAEGETVVIEETKTRDHTENMLHAFGADIQVDGKNIRISSANRLKACDVIVPGDISSAAFFLVAGLIKENSSITLVNVGLNKTRTGIIDIILEMGGSLTINNEKTVGGEKLGDITVSTSNLKGITIEGDIIPRLIDEIPIIALLATQAEGKTIIKDAEELRVKETDRIAAVVEGLSNLGAVITDTEDGMVIEGKTELTGGDIKAYDDHRIAMMGAIASLITKDALTIDDTDCIAISYLTFFDHLQSLY